MSKEQKQCAGRIWNGLWHEKCKNNGSLEHDGSDWCRIHHPPTVQEKKAQREQKRQAEWAEREARWEHYDKEEKLKTAARDFLREHHPDVYQRLRKEVGL